MGENAKLIILTWRDSRGPRAGAILVWTPAYGWCVLEDTSCMEGSERYRALTEHVPQREMLAALANDLVACRRLDLPDPEPVGYGGDSYWERATPIEGTDHG